MKTKIEEMNRISADEFIKMKKNNVVLILDNIRSMHNVGAAFRIADSFILDKIFLCGITAFPPRKEISKTALGAEEHVCWDYFEKTIDCINFLKIQNYKIIAIEQTCKSKDLSKFIFDKNQKYALIFGHEISGVDDKILECCDDFYEITQYGVKHSLNVSVVMGIVCWYFTKI